jgi:hypothetical protein
MKLLFASLALGVALAAWVAWTLGGSSGGCALLGALAGLALGTGGIVWQRRLLAVKPAAAMNAFVLVFLAKIFFVLVGALALRAGGHDWVSFAVAFPIAVLWSTSTGWVGALEPAARGAREVQGASDA